MPSCQPYDSITLVDNDYDEYCNDLLVCADDPSRVCAIFMKETETYLRCLHGAKKSDVYLME